MKASKLIKELERIIKTTGDIEVFRENSDCEEGNTPRCVFGPRVEQIGEDVNGDYVFSYSRDLIPISVFEAIIL